MSLIDQVKQVCDRLAPHGWRNLFLQHGLDIAATDLKAELTKELPGINRNLKGFEDFAFEGIRGIEAGNPARSLLYHAIASPNVTEVGGKELEVFPTLAEIESIENYVFGVEPPSLADLINRAQGDLMAIVVFASEYRPAPETVHRKHADMCFSRTGVARVGTAEAVYDAKNRGFIPFVEGNDYAFGVLPARYSAYIAVQLNGNEDVFGPMNFNFRRKRPELFGRGQEIDQNRQFWVPLHKIFEGDECIRGLDLHVNLEANHLNEKLRRVHLELRKKGHDTGWSEPDINNPPFVFTERIAEWSSDPDYGTGLLMPVVHANLVEAATYQNRPLTFTVPPSPANGFAPSLLIESNGPSRPAPEYVHVRHLVRPDGTIVDLNDQANVAEEVRRGGYQAQHYLDFTADGWIDAIVPELANAFPRQIPAYSMVTAPDFYPNCDQRELLEWWLQRVPSALRSSIWGQVPPLTLSDERLAPNLQLEGANFRAEDDTVTTIVSLPSRGFVRQMPLEVAQTTRHAYLPDAAAGVFAPGWDTSVDTTDNTNHLAAYGLGSPFPEDAKLCAALSAFWPAVAPDTGRSFSATFATVSPMTDAEIIDLPWDGVAGPKVVVRNNQELVEYTRFQHVDYVDSSLNQKFSLALTGQVDVNEYTSRVLAMARAYQAIGISSNREALAVLSFRAVDPNEGELQEAQAQTGVRLQGNLYRFEFYRRGRELQHDSDITKVYYEMLDRIVLFVGAPPRIIARVNNGAWQTVRTN
ncbi:hypothetical protein [Mastigocoleus testarum]|uniref:Uncharacterized protein n=1 Tax=Mastigocoleus testarum BC008 TaxID=371196 RepID=A0A0V7ZSQ2_9CYAN|nr:hypothetical protein [Mastigocoleus testarum]KST67708.1 hypothetical protein BC008_43930 [Mastigocoleus testarum BC008]